MYVLKIYLFKHRLKLKEQKKTQLVFFLLLWSTRFLGDEPILDAINGILVLKAL